MTRELAAWTSYPLRVVQLIKKRREDGESLRAIASALNEEGVPTKRGGAWYASTVRNALKLAS